jgi:hypothetical protein
MAHLAFYLDGATPPLRFNTGTVAKAGADVASSIAANEKNEMASYQKYKGLAEVKMAVQAATMWNLIYTPVEYGPLAPVARGWDFTRGATSKDYSYAIFDWYSVHLRHTFITPSSHLHHAPSSHTFIIEPLACCHLEHRADLTFHFTHLICALGTIFSHRSCSLWTAKKLLTPTTYR